MDRYLSDDAFFAEWAAAMVKAEISHGQFDRMWERIRVKLDDLYKVEELIAEVWPGSRMVEK